MIPRRSGPDPGSGRPAPSRNRAASAARLRPVADYGRAAGAASAALLPAFAALGCGCWAVAGAAAAV